MNICIYGVGGVGGYFGALITRALIHQHNIYFIARGKHKEAICSKGLTVKKSGGEEVITVHPTLCTDNINTIPQCDIVIIAVKSYDLDQVTRNINLIMSESTIILPLLNGVDIYQRIRKHVPGGVVLPSCVYVGTHINEPGVIFQKGGNCKIVLGIDPENPGVPIDPLLNIIKSASVNIELCDDVQGAIWSKYMFIAAYGLVTAAFNKTIGEVVDNVELGSITRNIMSEIHAIAVKLNIKLPSGIVQSSYEKAKDFPYEAKTSFQRDVETKGKLNEGDLFGDTILRLGKQLVVSVGYTKRVYAKLLNDKL